MCEWEGGGGVHVGACMGVCVWGGGGGVGCTCAYVWNLGHVVEWYVQYFHAQHLDGADHLIMLSNS